MSSFPSTESSSTAVITDTPPHAQNPALSLQNIIEMMRRARLPHDAPDFIQRFIAQPAVQPSEGGPAHTAEPFLTADLPVFPATPDSVTQVAELTADQPSEGGPANTIDEAQAAESSTQGSDGPGMLIPLELVLEISVHEARQEAQRRKEFLEAAEVAKKWLLDEWYNSGPSGYDALLSVSSSPTNLLTSDVVTEQRLCRDGIVCGGQQNAFPGCQNCETCIRFCFDNGDMLEKGLSKRVMVELGINPDHLETPDVVSTASGISGEAEQTDAPLASAESPAPPTSADSPAPPASPPVKSALVVPGMSYLDVAKPTAKPGESGAPTRWVSRAIGRKNKRRQARKKALLAHLKRLEDATFERTAAAPGRVAHVKQTLLAFKEAYKVAEVTLERLTSRTKQVTDEVQQQAAETVDIFLTREGDKRQQLIDNLMMKNPQHQPGDVKPGDVLSVLLYSPEFIAQVIAFLTDYVGEISGTDFEVFRGMVGLRNNFFLSLDNKKLNDRIRRATFLRLILVKMLGTMNKFTVLQTLNENGVWNFVKRFLDDLLAVQSTSSIEAASKLIEESNPEGASQILKTWMSNLLANTATRFLSEIKVNSDVELFFRHKVIEAKDAYELFLLQMVDLMEKNGGQYVRPEAATDSRLLFLHRLRVLEMLYKRLNSRTSLDRIARRDLVAKIDRIKKEISRIQSSVKTLASAQKDQKAFIDDRSGYSFTESGVDEFHRLKKVQRDFNETNKDLSALEVNLAREVKSLETLEGQLKKHDLASSLHYEEGRESIRELLENKGHGMVFDSTVVTRLFAELFQNALSWLTGESQQMNLDGKMADDDKATFDQFWVVWYNLIRKTGCRHAGFRTEFSETPRADMKVQFADLLNEAKANGFSFEAKSGKSGKSGKKSAEVEPTFEEQLEQVFEMLLGLLHSDGDLQSTEQFAYSELSRCLRIAAFNAGDAQFLVGFVEALLTQKNSGVLHRLHEIILMVHTGEMTPEDCMHTVRLLRERSGI